MGKAKPENCTHPSKSKERVSYGRYRCARCGTDVTPAGRTFEIRHSERVVLTHGDRVVVSREHHGGSFQGIFLWSEESKSGRHYLIAETQTWRPEPKSPLREDWAAIRHVQPAHVRQAPGVRDRKAREEAA